MGKPAFGQQLVPVPIQGDQGYPRLTNPDNMVSVSPLSSFNMQPKEVLEYLKKFAMMYPPFWWQFDFVNIAASSTVAVTKTIQNDSWFVGIYMIVVPKIVATVTQLFFLEIKDQGKTLSFMDEPLRSEMISGTATEPFYFPSPMLFEPDSRLTMIITDRMGVANNEVHVIIGGSKIHK